jgi:hypothetical protein
MTDLHSKQAPECLSCGGSGQEWYQARDGEYNQAACGTCGNGRVGSRGTGRAGMSSGASPETEREVGG